MERHTSPCLTSPYPSYPARTLPYPSITLPLPFHLPPVPSATLPYPPLPFHYPPLPSLTLPSLSFPKKRPARWSDGAHRTLHQRGTTGHCTAYHRLLHCLPPATAQLTTGHCTAPPAATLQRTHGRWDRDSLLTYLLTYLLAILLAYLLTYLLTVLLSY